VRSINAKSALLIPACTMFIERLAGDRQIAAQYTPVKKRL
jgi:hypothetical protein